MANWTPHGFIGALFTLINRYAPAPAGLTPASYWGLEEHIEELFRAAACGLSTTARHFAPAVAKTRVGRRFRIGGRFVGILRVRSL